MLPHEIESLADTNIELVQRNIESVGFYIDCYTELNPRVLRTWYSDLHIYANGFDRLKTTMVHEIEKRKRHRQILIDLHSPFQSEKLQF